MPRWRLVSHSPLYIPKPVIWAVAVSCLSAPAPVLLISSTTAKKLLRQLRRTCTWMLKATYSRMPAWWDIRRFAYPDLLRAWFTLCRNTGILLSESFNDLLTNRKWMDFRRLLEVI